MIVEYQALKARVLRENIKMQATQSRPALIKALERSARRNMSREEARDQRISFVIGGLEPEASATKEEVSKVLAHQIGD